MNNNDPLIQMFRRETFGPRTHEIYTVSNGVLDGWKKYAAWRQTIPLPVIQPTHRRTMSPAANQKRLRNGLRNVTSQGADLASKFPRSQSDRAPVGHPQTSQINGWPNMDQTWHWSTEAWIQDLWGCPLVSGPRALAANSLDPSVYREGFL